MKNQNCPSPPNSPTNQFTPGFGSITGRRRVQLNKHCLTPHRWHLRRRLPILITMDQVSYEAAGASSTAFSQSLSKWGIWEWCILIIWLLSALVLGNSWSHIPHLNLSICPCILKTTNVFWRSSQSRPYSQFLDRYDEKWLQCSQIKIYYILKFYLSQVLFSYFHYKESLTLLLYYMMGDCFLWTR